MSGASGSRAGLATSDRLLAVLVALLSSLALAPGAFYGLPFGKAVDGGLRVLSGEIPYRDFWALYSPGSYYLTALAYRLFGTEVIVQGLATVAIKGASAGLAFAIARRAGFGRVAGLAFAAVFTGMFFQIEVELESYPPALLLILLALDRTQLYLTRGGGRRLVVVGALLALAACFKHDVGGYATIALAGGLVLAWWLAGERRPASWLPPARSLGLLAAGCAAVGLPVVVWLLVIAGSEAWNTLILYPLTDFQVVRGEIYPPLVPRTDAVRALIDQGVSVQLLERAAYQNSKWLLCHLPELAFAIGAVWFVARRRELEPASLGLAAICLVGLPLYWFAAHTQTNTHLYSMAILAAFLGGIVWRHEVERPSAAPLLRPAIAVVALLWTAALAVPPAKFARPVLGAIRQVGWPGGETLPFDGVRGIVLRPSQHDAYLALGSFVRANTAEGEPIYVGVARHDAMVIGDERLYAVTGRPSATRYNELHPAVVDRVDVQREMIDDMERQGVRCVILWNFGSSAGAWSDEALERIKTRRQASLPHLGATLLDEYLHQEFELLATYGEYELRWRRGIPAPVLPPPPAGGASSPRPSAAPEGDGSGTADVDGDAGNESGGEPY